MAPDFWQIIASTHSDTRAGRLARLKEALAPLTPIDLIAFDTAYRTQRIRACHWDLRAAAFPINGGASDDGFDYFRDWLIAKSEEVFEGKTAESLGFIARYDRREKNYFSPLGVEDKHLLFPRKPEDAYL